MEGRFLAHAGKEFSIRQATDRKGSEVRKAVG
jgi:hypothetical protein